MADKPPATLPADFFSVKPSATKQWSAPDTLPANFDFDAPPSQEQAQPKNEDPGFMSSLWNTVKSGPANLSATGNAINQAMLHPIDTLSGMGAQIEGTARKSKQAFQQGNPVKGVRDAVNTGINLVAPGLGTQSSEAGEDFDAGRYRTGLGKTAGIGINTAIGLKTPQIMEGAAKLPQTVRRLTTVDPRVATNRWARPVPSDSDFPARIPQTLGRVLEANEGQNPGGTALGAKNGVTAGKLDVIPATQKAIDTTRATFGKWLERGADVQASGDNIVKATIDALSPVAEYENPAAIQSAIKEVQQAYGGRRLTMRDLDTLRVAKNAELDAFYDKATGKQIADQIAGKTPAIVKAQRDAIAEMEYRGLDPEGAGSGPRQVKTAEGDLIDLRRAAERRNNAIVAEQPLTPLGKVVDPLKGALRSLWPGKATGAGIAYAEGSEGRSLPLMRRSFEAVRGTPVNKLPSPGDELYPRGTQPGAMRELPSPNSPGGTMYTEKPADTSYVRSAPLAPHQEVNRMRTALPAGSPLFTQGTSVPDMTSGYTGARPMPLPELPAGKPFMGPSELSGRAGDVTRMIPVRNPQTGLIEYIPEPAPTPRSTPLSQRLIVPGENQ